MRKIITLFLLFLPFSVFAKDFDFEKELASEIGHNAESILKIDFSGEKTELIHSSIDYFKDTLERTKIEKLNDILKKIGKEKIKNLLEQNVVQIRGAEFLCGKVNDMKTQDCIFDDKKEYFLNTSFSNFYKINSETDKIIELTIYPISPDYYVYDNYDIVEKKVENENIKSPKITFFHNIYDIYNLKFIDLVNKKSITNFSKNYKLVKTKYGNYIYIPYYKVKLNLKKGENFFKFFYEKHIIDKYQDGDEIKKLRFS